MQNDGRRYRNVQRRRAPAVLRDVHERIAARLLLPVHARPLGTKKWEKVEAPVLQYFEVLDRHGTCKRREMGGTEEDFSAGVAGGEGGGGYQGITSTPYCSALVEEGKYERSHYLMKT